MKCERCQENDASVHISQTVNGQVSEQHLCTDCAREEGLDSQFSSPFQSAFGPFLSSGFFGGSIFNPTGGIPAFGGAAATPGRELVCPKCGTTFDAFRKSGLFGCSQCYDTFREKLDPVLRRVQGGTRHIGRQVCRSEETREQMVLKTKLAELRKGLAASVAREAYEEAARLRDEVHALEARICALDGESNVVGTADGGKGKDAPKDAPNNAPGDLPGNGGDMPDNGKGKGASA